jgi:hypothetical protein
VWHVKEHSLLKAMSAKHRSKIAALSPVMMAAEKIAEKLLGRLYTIKQTNMQSPLAINVGGTWSETGKTEAPCHE